MVNHITYHNNKLFYHKEGEGKIPILLFHGFGQDHKIFAAWFEELKNNYTLYSFDLFFHGDSHWSARTPLEKRDWREILELLFTNEKMDAFDVAGFSLGGKFALATLEAFPDKVKRVILLAPDGIKTSFWYSFATYPIIIRALFKSMILHPDRLHRVTKILRTFGLVDKGLVRFAESQMDTPEKRKRVYLSWVYFRHLKFNLDRVARLVNDHQVSFTIILGKYDRIIAAKDMNRILKKLSVYRLEILDTGHQGIIEESKIFLGRNN